MGPGCRQERRASKRPQRWTCRDRRKMPCVSWAIERHFRHIPIIPIPQKPFPEEWPCWICSILGRIRAFEPTRARINDRAALMDGLCRRLKCDHGGVGISPGQVCPGGGNFLLPGHQR